MSPQSPVFRTRVHRQIFPMKSHVKSLKLLGACQEGCTFADQFASWQQCWDAIPRGDWSLWLLGNLAGAVGTPERLKIVGVCSSIAREALPIYERRCPNDPRVRTCLDTLDRYAASAATLEEVCVAAADAADAARSASAAWSAADAAAWSAAWSAAYAAWSAWSAAYAARSAADAAAWSAAYAATRSATSARVSMQKKTADIVRQHYPAAPELS